MGGPAPSTVIGPGLGAFLAFFALAVALFFILRNMNARMRRMAYRERDRLAALEAQQAQQAAEVSDGKSGTVGDGAKPPASGRPDLDPAPPSSDRPD
ncbi:MAG: hypothetical protein WAR57_13420 [Candidatus Phosphoribacter sp.]|nr:hypothetical protein [Actinomycetales bacterium]